MSLLPWKSDFWQTTPWIAKSTRPMVCGFYIEENQLLALLRDCNQTNICVNGRVSHVKPFLFWAPLKTVLKFMVTNMGQLFKEPVGSNILWHTWFLINNLVN
jgi:hypothetical protein